MVINHANDSQRPTLLTSREKGVAVVQGLEEFEKNGEDMAFVKAILDQRKEVKSMQKSSCAFI